MKCFFDTNVLVYLFDADSPDKRKRARTIFRDHTSAGDIVLSTQVLQEFYVTVTRKLARPVDASKAFEAVSSFAELSIVQIDINLVLAAIHRSRKSEISAPGSASDLGGYEEERARRPVQKRWARVAAQGLF